MDIGDNQSVENALSTFSSHVKNMADILKESKVIKDNEQKAMKKIYKESKTRTL